MSDGMFGVYAQDVRNPPWVFRRQSDDGRMSVPTDYRHLVCDRCGKLDEGAALALGVPVGVQIRSTHGLLLSADDFYIFSEPARQFFDALLPNQLDYHRIPGSAHVVACGRVRLEPDEADPSFQMVPPRCGRCRRPSEVVWGPAVTRLPEPRLFYSVNIESCRGVRECWLVNAAVAAELRRNKSLLTGMVLVPHAVEYTA